MKARKRRLEFFSLYNHTGIEQHFNKMARKGWMIESITNLYWTYRRIEPKDIHFCVSYYPRASDFDPGPSEEQQTFHDFCAHTGWQLACTWHQMQVFYNGKESPIPLDTDPVMEVDVLHRACRKNFLPSNFLLLIMGLLFGGYFLGEIFHDPIGLLTHSSRMVSGFAYFCVFLVTSVELLVYFRWLRKAKKAARDGNFLDTPDTSKFQITVVVLLLAVVLWWFANLIAADNPLMLFITAAMFLYIFGTIFLVNGIKQGLKKAKASRGLNRFLTLAACFVLPMIMTGIVVIIVISANRAGYFSQTTAEQDRIPLSVSDLYDVDQEDYIMSYDRQGTLLLEQMEVDAFPNWENEGFHELPDLGYTITTVKAPFLYDWCRNLVFQDWDDRNNGIPEGHRNVYREVDAAPWGANAAYRIYQEEGWWENRYLLCYENRIVEIQFDLEPTEEDMSVVNQKLNP